MGAISQLKLHLYTFLWDLGDFKVKHLNSGSDVLISNAWLISACKGFSACFLLKLRFQNKKNMKPQSTYQKRFPKHHC